LDLVPIEADLNQERLSITLPAAGNYRLTVDNQPVGDYSAAQLKGGINLAFNDKTPQYQQAQKVLQVNEHRRALEVRLRSFAQVKIMLLNAKINADDDAAVAKYFETFLANLKSNQPYFKGQFDNYTKTKPELDNIEAEIEKLTQELWQINQPTLHHYELALVP
jgi:hypothetical protein